MRANYKTPKYGFCWGTHSGNCKQCANKANCGEKCKDGAEWCEKFRPLAAKKRRKKKWAK